MDGKHEEFWRQGDFGYVKNEIDTLKTICKPSAKVGGWSLVVLNVHCLACVSKPHFCALFLHKTKLDGRKHQQWTVRLCKVFISGWKCNSVVVFASSKGW